MPKYFTIERIKESIQHLQNYDSNWVIVPLVFAVNGVNEHGEININQGGRAGSDRFLNRYFHGSLIGLPQFPNGVNSLRPRFSDIYGNMRAKGKGDDYVLHQSTKLWANVYSSRGYREMRSSSIVLGEKAKFQLTSHFWTEWSRKLPEDFCFEELLVWLYAFHGIDDSIENWEALSNDFQQNHLGLGNAFEQDYLIRFNVRNGIPWSEEFLDTRPNNEDYRQQLIISYEDLREEYINNDLLAEIHEVVTFPLESKATEELWEVVQKFSDELNQSGVSFGIRHKEVVRTFIASLITKPFVILTGLSGSGKTQIASKFGEWLGEDCWSLIPVRPDWTGGEVLFGYENALDQSSNREWFVPNVLEFMLRANENKQNPYLLILDEMNLAHVERYFGDFLSGLESRTPVLPNLFKGEDGRWRLREDEEARIPIPSNLFVVGTVNIDETTYMFSPKVLDRANTIEFRVQAEELNEQNWKPKRCSVGDEESVRTLLSLSRDDDWQHEHPASNASEFADKLRNLHRILSGGGFEFGHRVFYEAIRYVAFYEASGESTENQSDWIDAFDFQVLQKILPRLHGSQKRLGPTLRAVVKFCYDLEEQATEDKATLTFDPEEAKEEDAKLKRSFNKIKRMYRNLKAYQFTSFTE